MVVNVTELDLTSRKNIPNNLEENLHGFNTTWLRCRIENKTESEEKQQDKYHLSLSYRGEPVGPEPFRLEVVPFSALEVVEVGDVRLTLVVPQHLRAR